MKSLELSQVNQFEQICSLLAQSPFYQKLGVGGVLTIYMTALEYGLPPMYCLNGGLYNVEGKVTPSANAMNIMLVNAGWTIEFIEMTDKACHLRFIPPNGKNINEYRYTIEDARNSGYLGKQGLQGTWERKPKQNWLDHPRDMLFNRCLSGGAKKFAPAVVGNMHLECEFSGENAIEVPFEPVKQEPEKIEAPKCHKGLDDVEQFKKRHNIVEGEKIYDYVLNISNKKKIPKDQAMTQCFLNEEIFIESFKEFEQKTSQ